MRGVADDADRGGCPGRLWICGVHMRRETGLKKQKELYTRKNSGGLKW